MPIPSTRAELIEQVSTAFAKLMDELHAAGPEFGSVVSVDSWTVKDLLAVRAWWTHRVVDWVEAGRRGESPVIPAPGYRWHETPRLNAAIVLDARLDEYDAVLRRLEDGFERVLDTVESLSDVELLEPGAFDWAGKWPVSRWVSINTGRQYVTARTFVRRALKKAKSSG